MALLPGLYERLITRELTSALEEVKRRSWHVEQEPLDGDASHEVLARYVSDFLKAVLDGLPQEDRLERQVEICNRVLEFATTASRQESEPQSFVASPPAALLSISDRMMPDGTAMPIPRPHGALRASALLINARGEAGVGHALEREIPSADRIDLLCAFIRWNGLRLVLPQLKEYLGSGRQLRVITTTYTGSTERRALDELVRLGAQVKVSYETRSTRLHAKAWLFQRATGFSTAYIGSSNLTHWALVDGVEWNVRLSQVSAPEILEKFQATFENYWAAADCEAYDPKRDAERFDRAVNANTTTDPLQIALLDVIPYPHQREILERLTVERERHNRWRNLVVAATGTGKTIVAALDYRRLRDRFANASLLFVAHRKEILNQSLSAFRTVLRDGSFGQRYVDGHVPKQWRHVFASVQALNERDLSDFDPEAFDVVIVDEFHRAAAPTYRRLLSHLKPKVLLGLTATPERADGQTILDWFDGQIAIELRLWEALERGLLCPFHYFGVHDDVDLSKVTWSRRGYDIGELQNLYDGNHARARLVAQAVQDKVADPRRMRALGFCVSIAHATFMASEFSRIGLPAAAVSSDTPGDERDEALGRLRNRELNALFSVDLLNEGVDLPDVDTVLFLRPTESATVFLQQLGRGLRQAEGKSCLTVLDFIGNAHQNFRFDQRYRVLTQTTRAAVIRQVEQGFPQLPPGCKILLDTVSQQVVVDNLRRSLGGTFTTLIRELNQMGPDVSLAEFLRETALSPDDLYRSAGWSWTRLKREVGRTVPAAGPREDHLLRAMPRLLHTDDPNRIAFLRRLLSSPRPPQTDALTEAEQRIVLGLHFTLWGVQERTTSIDASLADLWSHPAIIGELRELLEILEDRAEHLSQPISADAIWQAVPIALHASYSRDDILTAFGEMSLARPYPIREGVKFNERTRTDLFFITLEKSESRYSESTRYKDRAISPDLFHWESQSTTSLASPTGQRYIHHRDRGTNVMLFVRRTPTIGNRTAPYVCLGLADHVSHERERPIAIVWRLRNAMPADVFRESRIAG